MAWDIECANLSRQDKLAGRVARADGLFSRMKGLLGARGLEPDQGLWLAPCRQVHTWFMRFTIDVVFLNKQQQVVGICRRLKPWRFSPVFWRAHSALELAAGRADGVQVGDQLRLSGA